MGIATKRCDLAEKVTEALINYKDIRKAGDLRHDLGGVGDPHRAEELFC